MPEYKMWVKFEYYVFVQSSCYEKRHKASKCQILYMISVTFIEGSSQILRVSKKALSDRLFL